MTYSPKDIQEAVNKYCWYTTIKITDEISTSPQLNSGKRSSIPNPCTLMHYDYVDFKDKSVLDIGCRDGLHSFEAEKRGAKSILGIDTCLSIGAVEFLIPYFKSKVKMQEKSLYDIEGSFDIVIFAGVLYHLRYPFLAIKKISELLVEGGTLILETAIWNNHNDIPLVYCPNPKDSPYKGGSSVTFFNRKGLRDNLEVYGFEDMEFLPNKYEDYQTGITRASLRCNKGKSQINPRLKKYWDGDNHKIWQNP